MESDINEIQNNKNSTAIGCFWAIVFIIGIGWFIYNKVQDYNYGEKDPFWKGTQLMQICKVPYYSASDCYKLNATLFDDKKTVQIHFKNGGYVISSNLTCYNTTHYSNYTDPSNKLKYVFCRSWDSNGQQWDFAPIWAPD